MKKVKITADGVLAIIQGIFNDRDVNVVIDDPSAPGSWNGKTVQEILNVEYYTFKYRPVSSEEFIAKKLAEGVEVVDKLMSLNRSFCLAYLTGVERLYSKNVDMLTVSATLEFWLQASKLKFLEDLVENCNIGLSGIRVDIEIDGEKRKAVIIFDKPDLADIQPQTVCGEMAQCEVGVNIMLYPDVVSYSDYEISFTFMGKDNNTITSSPVPLSSFSAVNTMTPKSVPYAQNRDKVGSINLSCANSFVLVFDGYNNEFINYITDKALKREAVDNNQVFAMSIKRGDTEPYEHEVIIKDHQIIINADTGNETHTLNLVTKGM